MPKRVVVMRPGEPPEPKDINASLFQLRTLIDNHTEAIPAGPFTLHINTTKRLPLNFKLGKKRVSGTVVLMKDTSLDARDQQMAIEMLRRWRMD